MRYSTWLRKTGLPFLLILFLALFLSGRLEAGTNQWTTHGPGGGTITILAVDPSAPSTLYAGTEGGGAFKSTDGGGSWFAINSGLINAHVKAIAIDPVTTSTLYAGTFPPAGGVFKSTDSGGNWSAVNTGLTDPDVYALAIDPVTTTTLYAGTEGGGIYKSTDGGSNWSAINNGLTDLMVHSLAIDPTTPTSLYAGTYGGGVFKSTNGGGNWSAINTGLTSFLVIALAIDPVAPGKLYVGTEDGGVFKSNDGGANWFAMNAGLTNTWVNSLAIDPVTPDTIYAGTEGGGVFDRTYLDVTGVFSFRKIITIDNTKVSGAAELSNFPVLISLTGDWLKTTTVDPTNGRIENDNGYDIVFYDGDGSTLLNHEIEEYDGVNGVLLAWVKIPILYYNTDTVFFMDYGNSGISSPQENPAGVWNANYAGVWHLNESVTDEGALTAVHKDSTTNGNHGDQDGNANISAKIANGQDFDGIDDLIQIADDPVLTPAGDMTVSAWFKLYQLPVTEKFRIVCKVDASSFWSYSLYVETDNRLTFVWENDSQPYYAVYNTSLSPDTWYHVVGIRDGTGPNLRIFINGSDSATTPDSAPGTLRNTDGHLRIGARDFGWDHIDGVVDEVRLSNIARSPDWIATEYNNQNDPSGFYSLNSEQTLPSLVTGLTATAVPGQIDLSWTTPDDGGNPIVGYKIERRSCSGSWSVLVADTGTTGVSYSDTTAVPSTCYGYRVSAINGMGTGPASAEDTANAYDVPSQVTGLSTTAVAGQINLSWTTPSDQGDPIAGYKIERRTCSGSWAVLVADTGTTGTGYSDTTVVPSTCYGYRVSAINGVGTGAASTEATATAVNLVPTASAGPDQTVDESVAVMLDGSNSTDPDDGIASYLWTQIGGTSVTLSDAAAVQPTFTSPIVGAGGEALTFELTVTDNGGLQSTDTCIVNVTWSNLPPAADAGTDQTVGESVAVMLDGSNSTDPDDDIASYLWTQLSGTPVTLSDSAAIQPTFTSPAVGTGGEALTFELKVTDNGGLESTDTCIVNVTWANSPPTADAGSDQNVDEGMVVMLDGSNSTDPDDGIASYQWTQLSGVSVTLSDAAAIQPTFTPPEVDSAGATLTFRLKVTDVGGLSATDTLSITVNDLTPPDVPVIYAVAGTTDNQPTLDWENVGDLDYYVVEYDTSPGFGSAVAISNITLSEYQMPSPLADGTWYWRVKAVDTAGNQSAWSVAGSFVVDTSAYCLLDPDKPVLLSPTDGAVNVSQTPTLRSGPFVDPDACSFHDKTRWQISEYFDFSIVSADIEAVANYLTSYQVPALFLEPDTTYYWQVRYWGSNGNPSPCSDVYSFTTGPATNDGDDNGIPDGQQVGAFVDLDGDSIFDNSQSSEIKSLQTATGGGMIGIRPLDSLITKAQAVDSSTLPDVGDIPLNVPYGLAAFRLIVTDSGDWTTVRLFLSEPVPDSASLVIYDSVNGWRDYSAYADFNADQDVVTLQLKDGGVGDNDHSENRAIVGLCGIGFYSNSMANAPVAISPADESVISAGSVTLETSAYSDPDGDPHTETNWLVRRADRVHHCSDYDISFEHVGTTGADLTEHTVDGLEPGLKYYWMAGYKDFGTGNIIWSKEYAFKVGTSRVGDLIGIDPGTEVADFRMVSFVQWPDDPTADSVFGVDTLAADYAENFRIGTYDPTKSSPAYEECGNGLKIEPGRAYWVLARNGLDVIVDGVPVSLSHDIEVKLLYNSSNGNGWNMIGSPNSAGYYWKDVEVLEYDAHGNIVYGPEPILLLPDNNPYIDKRLWRWENGSYYADTIFMEPYEGYWVKARKPRVFLRFAAGAQAKLSNPDTRLANLMREGKWYLKLWPFTPRMAVADTADSPPRPMANFGSNSQGILQGIDALGSTCFIDSLTGDFPE
jgi:photosystem II stability/assembly factor-like uncharacterized protein